MKRLAIVALFAVSMMLTGCMENEKQESETQDTVQITESTATEDQEFSREVFAMDTYMTLTAYGTNGEDAIDKAEQEILSLDELLSTGKDTSEISGLNQNGGGTLSDTVAYLLERSLELYEATDGAFDISIYPVMKAWGFTDQNYQVPDEQALTAALALVDGGALDYDTKTQTLTYEKTGMHIDLGGIAKGYTSARIMDIYRECGVTSGLVSLGGNVQVLGSKTDGSDWKVGIQSPDDSGDMLGVLKIQDKAVITSGGYERYFEADGKTYHHIIDPKTGYPAESGLSSVTIVSADGTLADGLSTSLFIMGRDKAIEYWRAHTEEFDMILCTDDDVLYVSEGIEDDFSSDYEIHIVSEEEER